MTILELKTGLFPDAERVAQAITGLDGAQEVLRADVTGLAPDDEAGWARIALAILAADLVVTL